MGYPRALGKLSYHSGITWLAQHIRILFSNTLAMVCLSLQYPIIDMDAAYDYLASVARAKQEAAVHLFESTGMHSQRPELMSTSDTGGFSEDIFMNESAGRGGY